MKRTLILRRESLADLSAEELGGVAGADSGMTCFAAACALVSMLTNCPAYCPNTPACPSSTC